MIGWCRGGSGCWSCTNNLATAKTGHEQMALQRQIDATDAQIDKLVYELYGLTEEEIKIVAATAKPHSAGHQS